MKKYIAILLMAVPAISKACITCNKELQNNIYNSTFYPNLFIMLSAFIAVGIIVAIFSILATRKYKNTRGLNADSKELSNVPLTSAAVVLGIGLGGFIDGIVFHQILQLHEMLSNKVSTTTLLGKSINMFWDGIFHFYTLLVTITGTVLMWKLLQNTVINRSGYLFSGGLLTGWALFNVVEGIIDHQILKLHNVNEFQTETEVWNIGFLVFSLLLLLLGYLLIRNGIKRNAAPTTIIRTLPNTL